MSARSTLEFSPGAAGPLLADEPDLSWQDAAECQYTDPDLFFPEQGVNATEARRICMVCPVRVPCLQYALDSGDRWGIYGGLSYPERRRILRDRARAALAA